MLFLTGAIVGVFTAQDLLLFYVFFEAMLIPLYVLIGVWGGAGPARRDDQVRHLHDGRLAADARVDHRLRPPAGHVRPDRDAGTSSNDWLFLGFAAAFAVKAPLFPFHGWLPDAYRESSPEVVGGALGRVSKAAAYGFLRIAIAKFPEPADDFRTPILVLAADRARLRLAARVPRARHPRRDRVLVARADGPDHARPLRGQRPRASTAPCCRWSTTA